MSAAASRCRYLLLLSLSSFSFFFSTSFPPLYQHHYHDCYSHHHHYFIIITIIITIIIISTIITVVNIFKSFHLGVKHLTEQPVVKGSTCLLSHTICSNLDSPNHTILSRLLVGYGNIMLCFRLVYVIVLTSNIYDACVFMCV